jgi:hypothetical protein
MGECRAGQLGVRQLLHSRRARAGLREREEEHGRVVRASRPGERQGEDACRRGVQQASARGACGWARRVGQAGQAATTALGAGLGERAARARARDQGGPRARLLGRGGCSAAVG